MESPSLHCIADPFTIRFNRNIPPSHSELNQWHDAFELSFYVDASLTMFLRDRCYEVSGGDLLFVGDREIHRIVYGHQRHYDRFVLTFRESYIREVLKAAGIPDLLAELTAFPIRQAHLADNQARRITDLLQDMIRAYHTGRNAPIRLWLSSLLLLCRQWLQAAQETTEATSLDKVVGQVVAWLDGHYQDSFRLEDMETRFFVSRYHLIRLFRRQVGMTPVAYLQQRRIIEARHLLRRTGHPISEIALQCGFLSTQHFHRIFRRTTGCTPRAYRHAYRTLDPT